MNSLFSFMRAITPNTGFPLHFETFGTNTSFDADKAILGDESADSHQSYAADSTNMTDPSDYGVSPQDDKQLRKMLELHAPPRDSARIAKAAQESINKHPHINVAYNLMGLYVAKTYEEALEYFRKAIEVTPKLSRTVELDPDKNLKESKDGIYLCLYFRPMFRAMMGAALCYRRLGDFEKALKMYQRMLKLDPTFRAMQSNYINFKSMIPLTYLLMDKHKEAHKFMNKHADDFTYNSLRCAWLFNYAFCQFKNGLFPLDRQETQWKTLLHNHDPSQEDPRTCALYRVVFGSSDACAVLFGIKQLPKLKIPQFVSTTPGHNRAIPHEPLIIQYQYAKDAKAVWDRHPEFLNYMRTYARSLVAVELASSKRITDPDVIRFIENYGYTVRTPFKKIIEDGVFKNAHSLESGTLAHIITMNSTADDLQILADKGFPLKDEFNFGGSPLRPLHQASYYDRDPTIVKILLEHDNPFHAGKAYSSPVSFAANQGNVRVLRCIFEKYPEKAKDQQLLEELLYGLFHSSCYDCIKFGETCQRCENSSHKHSKYCSFEDCVEYLVEIGIQYNPKQESFLANRTQNLRKVYMNALEERKKKVVQETLRKCHRCGKTAQDTGKKLKLCGGCASVKYCSKQCQIEDWPDHRQACNQIAAESLREQGNEQFKNNKFAEAIEIYQKAFVKDPKDAKILGNMALCHIQLSQFDRALEVANDCIALDPQFSKGHIRKAQALQKLKEKGAAKKVVRAALKKMPKDVGLLQMAKILGC